MSASEPEEDENGNVTELVNSGAEIAGGAIGASIGLLGGPLGVVAGSAAGVVATKVLRRVGSDLSQRLLGPREKVRVGGTLALATATIQMRIDAGEPIRNDDFFNRPNGARSKADEFAEAILLKAQREAEEKKIPYIAQFLANAVFDSRLNVEMAHQLIKAADSLTYRQFILLKLAAVKQQYNLRSERYGAGTFNRGLVQVMYEIYDLARREFINFSGTKALGVSDVIPAAMSPMGMGAHLFNYLRLQNIPDAEVLPLARILA